MDHIEQWVGIDGCKRWLDVDQHPREQSFRVSISDSGIRAFCLQQD